MHKLHKSKFTFESRKGEKEKAKDEKLGERKERREGKLGVEKETEKRAKNETEKLKNHNFKIPFSIFL